MKYLPFILKHLRHNWIRTTSTVLAIVVGIFLFCTLQTIIAAINWGLRSTNASRLVVRNAVSLMYYLPLSYKEKMRSISGVTNVSVSNFFLGFMGGRRPDYTMSFPDRAVDAEEFLAMYPEYILSPEDKKAFLEDQRGCIAGPDLAKKHGWKAGDSVQLESIVYPIGRPFEFVVRGIYGVDNARYPGTDAGMMFFHHKYLLEVMQNSAPAHTFIVGIADPKQAGAISKAIDQMFENSDRHTYTATENAFRAGFVSLAGNLALLLNLIGVAVTFTILIATANTMSMAVRERRKEIGILKTLGFGRGLVMTLILGEALLLGASGGALGVLLGHMTIKALPGFPLIGPAVRQFPNLGLSLAVGSAGFGMALLMGLAAGLVPGMAAYRTKIADILRAV